MQAAYNAYKKEFITGKKEEKRKKKKLVSFYIMVYIAFTHQLMKQSLQVKNLSLE